ncbi:MAG TPA: hypothetical protein VKD69_09540 [Vicinamibacterales bacterium]|nr:hypothetical protein [Vicinamibacterales bacterium]
MIRRAAAIVLVLTLDARLVHAQNTVLTVDVASADVYKGPSNIYPVIGHVSHGNQLLVSRSLGSWVKIEWADAPDGVGYVHATIGRVGAPTGPVAGAKAAPRGPSTASATASASASPAATPAPPPMRTPTVTRRTATRSTSAPPASRMLGLGGLIGSMSTVGATARTWRTNQFGIQLGLTRDAMDGDSATRVTSMQIEPGVVFSPFDRVGDYVWIRPYVGTTLSFRHQTLKGTAANPIDGVSDNGVGFRMFGGGELTFASLPQLGLSADAGYRRFPTPFPGFEPGPFSVTVAAHWYIR